MGRAEDAAAKDEAAEVKNREDRFAALKQRVEDNRAARNAAGEIVDLISGEFKGRPQNALEIMAGAIFNTIAPFLDIGTQSRELLPMTDAQARTFGSQRLPFGEFAGKRVDEVPLDRLHWYADQRFTDNLRRYLGSQRVWLEQRSAGE